MTGSLPSDQATIKQLLAEAKAMEEEEPRHFKCDGADDSDEGEDGGSDDSHDDGQEPRSWLTKGKGKKGEKKYESALVSATRVMGVGAQAAGRGGDEEVYSDEEDVREIMRQAKEEADLEARASSNPEK